MLIDRETYRYVDDQLMDVTYVRWQCWEYTFFNGMTLRFDFRTRLMSIMLFPLRDIPGITEGDVIEFVREHNRRSGLETKAFRARIWQRIHASGVDKSNYI